MNLLRFAPSFVLVSFALLTTSTEPRAQSFGEYENGDVLVGTQLSGSDLNGDDEVDRPLLVVIDTPYQVYDAAGTFIHVAAWAPNGTPARGARVYLSGHLVGRTDENGVLVFRWGVPGNEVEEYWLNGSGVQVRWDHNGETYGGGVWFSAFSRTSSFESDHLFVYTDRGVYNPGQTIHLRSIGWHLQVDFAPLREASVEYVLLDPSGTVVAGQAVVTDQFGAAATDLQLSPHAEEGVYELRANYEGATASARLRVEKFTPPVIDIEHTLGRFLTRDQDTLDFEVNLSLFTGGEFTSGRLAVDVLVEGNSRHHESREVEGAGPHQFSIDRSALDEITRGLFEDQRIEVQIAVEDAYGRADDLKRELRYTANPYIVIIEKDRDFYSTGDAVELVVRLTDRDRVPVRETEVTLVTSSDERIRATTDDGGTVQFSLTQVEGGFSVEVFLAGVEVALASDYIAWQEPQPMRSHISDVIVEENQPAHVSVTFPASFTPAEPVVHLDVVDTSGSLVNAVLVPIRYDGSRYVAEGTFVAPSWGSMLLTLFCLGSDGAPETEVDENSTRLGLMTEGQNLVVHPGRELQIHLDGVADSVAPGSDIVAQIRVTDRNGNPVDAVIGAAIVDEAVISLKDPLEITPMDHFYNPELRVLSTTGSSILTWPVVSRNWGGRVHDVALPPFPYLAGGRVGTNREMGFGDDMAAEYAEAEEEPGGSFFGLVGGASADAPPPPAEPQMQMMMQSAAVGSTPPVVVADELLAEGDYRSRRDGDIGPQPTEPIITIRTSFPETSLWEPLLYTTDGAAPLSATLPDEITRQQIALVASDANGGVGVLRSSIQVTQPLFVRADLPDALIVGDMVAARVVAYNYGEEAQAVTLSLSSEDVLVHTAPVTVEIDPGGVGVGTFNISAHRAGRFEYTVQGQSAERIDGETRQIWVRPSGRPQLVSTRGTLSGETPYSTEIDVPAGGQYTTVTLNVAFPAVSAGFAGLDAIHGDLQRSDFLSLGGEIISTALLYQYLREYGGSAADIGKLEAALRAHSPLLLAAQRADGGWGFWWDKESSPYITGYVLEALNTLAAAGFEVPPAAIQQAVHFLDRSLEGQTFDQDEISFWEGNTDQVQLGLTAEIFSIVAGVPRYARDGQWENLMQRLGSRFLEYLDSETPDVLTLAHAVLGLHRIRESGLITIDEERLRVAARHLVTVRRDAHWEPSWFNAYGGTIEATVTVLQVFQELGGDLLDVEARHTVRYLLSTRDEWGGWHNPRGTAAAIRGLILLGVGEEEIATTVSILIDGREVRSVTIDPADPFLSAVELRVLDLTDYLEPGVHTVEVRYGGQLDPDVAVTIAHWPEPVASTSTVELETVLGRSSVQVGGIVDYTVTIRSQTANTQLVRVDLAAPGNTHFDRPTVQDIRDRGLVDGYEWTDEGICFFVQLDGETSRELTMRLVATRSGEATVPAAQATVLSGEGHAVAVVSEHFVVE